MAERIRQTVNNNDEIAWKKKPAQMMILEILPSITHILDNWHMPFSILCSDVYILLQYRIKKCSLMNPTQRVVSALQRARLSRPRAIWLLPHPSPKFDRRHKGRLRKRNNLLTGEVVGGGEGAKSYDDEKAYSSINQLMLSEPTYLRAVILYIIICRQKFKYQLA